MVQQSRLEELERDECLLLLASKTVGRVVFTDRVLPAIQPVNYLLDGEEIVFRTGPGDKLAAATRNAVVAFEIDEVDERTHAGWSVVAVGQARELTDTSTGSFALQRRRIGPGSRVTRDTPSRYRRIS